MSKSRKKRKPPKRVLALPDLEQAKYAVLNTQIWLARAVTFARFRFRCGSRRWLMPGPKQLRSPKAACSGRSTKRTESGETA